MPPTPPLGPVCACPRPAAVVNAEIRALVTQAGGWLYGDTREQYETLRAEWTVATARERCEVVEAA